MIVVDDLRWAVRLCAEYVVTANIPYASGHAFAKLDLYRPCETGAPFKPCTRSRRPTLVFVHGGGWLDDASKESYALWLLPFLQLGWVVVNVEYRPSSVAPAPAALEDCLAALRWIAGNAQLYNIDTSQLVLGGPSAGGALALLVAAVASGGLGSFGAVGLCPVAVINWCGIVDLVELTTGPAAQGFALQWLGEQPDPLALATALSPVRHVRRGGVPVVTVHGREDRIVPYAQAVCFHDALTAAGVRNDLITLPDAGHAFDANAAFSAYPRILGFLGDLGGGTHPARPG